MTTPRTFKIPPALEHVVDDFLPPLEFVPDVSRAAWAELAELVVDHDSAEDALAAYIADNMRETSTNNERSRLIREGHPLARRAVELEHARKMGREVFRMHILEHRDTWTAHLDQLTRAELDNAGDVVRNAITRIRAAALVPATHTRRLAALDTMAEGHALGGWWEPANRAAWVHTSDGRLVDLDRELLPALEALASQLTMTAAADTKADR